MKKKNKIFKAIVSMVISLSMLLGCIPISFAQVMKTSTEPKGYVTISVEKFTLGLGYIKEPVKVPFYEDDNVANIVTRLLGEGNYSNTGTIDESFYLSKIKDNDTRTPNVPQYILDKCGSIGKRQDVEWLGEFDYTSMSGWMYAVNNSFPNVGASSYIPQDGDVIRWQFTTYGYGADIGGDGFGADKPYIDVANRDLLTAKIGDINTSSNKDELLSKPDVKVAYDNAYKVLENIEASQSEVDSALDNLNKSIDSQEKPSAIELKIPINQAIGETGALMYKETPNPKIGTIAGEWTIIALARDGHEAPKEYYEKYYKNVVDELSEKKGELSSYKYTEYSRVILGLTSIGKDVTNVGGYNLLEKLADFNKVKAQGINGPIFALIALDTNNYEIPIVEGVSIQTTREMLIDYILEKEIKKGTDEAGGWALSGTKPDPDMTAMAIQALAKYKDDEKVKPYIDRALNVLSNLQLNNGGYDSWGSLNCESIAQVIVALTALGIDPKTDDRFIKDEGNWTLSAMMEFYVDGGGFKHIINGNKNSMATDQGMYALVAYDRFVKGKNGLYDMTDVKIEEPEKPNTKPVINASDKIIKVGDKFNPMDGVTANDEEDGDITSKIEVEKNDVDTSKAGTYEVVYKVVDSKGSSTTKTIKVTVERNQDQVIPPSSGGGSTETPSIKEEKLIGSTRYETAVKVSNKGWVKSENVVLVNSNSMSDALSATPFAKSKNAPVLLTEKDSLNELTKKEITRLQVKNAYVIGGTNAIQQSVISQLESMGIKVDRISGDDRYETSLEIANRLGNISEIAVANGVTGLADAVSIAPIAASKNMAILLTSPTQGTKVVDNFLKNKNIKKSYVIGGKSSISDEVLNKLPNAKRLGGKDRNDTNAVILETFYTNRSLNNVFVAKDGMQKEDHLIDALALGVLAAKENSPVIIVGDTLKSSQRQVLKNKTPKVITQVGGGCENAFKEIKDLY